MEGIIEKYGWKKVAIVMVVACLLLLGFGIGSILNLDNKQPGQVKKDAVNSTTTNGTTNSNSSNSSNRIITTPVKAFSNTDYQLSYPQNLKEEKLAATGGASDITEFTDPRFSTNIQIAVYPKPKNSLEDAIKPYSATNYDADKLPLKYTDSTVYRMDAVPGSSLRRQVIFVNKPDKFFKITFEYSNDQIDTTTELDFSKMLISLK